MSSWTVADVAEGASQGRCEVSVGWSGGALVVHVDGVVDQIAAGALVDVVRCAGDGTPPTDLVVSWDRAERIAADARPILRRAGLGSPLLDDDEPGR